MDLAREGRQACKAAISLLLVGEEQSLGFRKDTFTQKVQDQLAPEPRGGRFCP